MGTEVGLLWLQLLILRLDAACCMLCHAQSLWLTCCTCLGEGLSAEAPPPSPAAPSLCLPSWCALPCTGPVTSL